MKKQVWIFLILTVLLSVTVGCGFVSKRPPVTTVAVSSVAETTPSATPAPTPKPTPTPAPTPVPKPTPTPEPDPIFRNIRYDHTLISPREIELFQDEELFLAFYRDIIRAVLNYEPVVVIPEEVLEHPGYHVVMNTFQRNNPLEHLSGTPFQNVEGTEINFFYSYEREEHFRRIEQIESKVEEIISTTIQEDFNLLEATLACYRYLASTSVYEESWADSAYGILMNGSGVCRGFTSALRLLLLQAGYDDGYSIEYSPSDREQAGHVWNMLLFGENWYHVDATWENGTSGGMLLDYFGMTDDERWSPPGVDTPYLREIDESVPIPRCTDDAFGMLRGAAECICDLRHHTVYIRYFDDTWVHWNTQDMSFTPIRELPSSFSDAAQRNTPREG